MTNAAVLETEQRAPVLPSEEVKRAADLLRNSVGEILSSWEEYQNSSSADKKGVREFYRPQGANGEGLWEVEDSGSFSTYSLLTSGAEWRITVQPGGIGSYRNPFISTWRKRRGYDGKDIIESPAKNSQEALGLAVKFVQQINGGEIPPALLQLSSRV
ncbi:hypothetical protein HYZ06_00785 [Candidatus Daviesbacteria bacterium]|nr:hypothetical protein [Candidatus Daviesbacteria bacterium]